MEQKINGAARTFAALLAGLAGMIALVLWSEDASRQAYLKQLDLSLRQSAQAIGQHMTDSVEMAELALVALRSEIDRNRDMPDLPARVDLFISHLTEHTPHLANLIYIDRSGQLVASTAAATPTLENRPQFSDREYFRHHQNDASHETYIGAPVVSRMTGDVIVPLTQRLEDAAGQFAGVVAADLPMSHLIEALGGMTLTQEASLLLARSDGTVLAHWPDYPALARVKNLEDQALSKIVQAATETIVVSDWPTDGLSRHSAAFQNEHPGLIVLIGARETQVLWQWIESARLRWILSASLVLLALALILRWRHQTLLNIRNKGMLQRREAEFELLAEASADLIERLTADGIREYVSPSSRQILGLSPEELIGKSVFDFVPVAEHGLARASLERLQEGATLQRVLIRHQHPEGREVWLETTLSRLSTQRPGPSAIVAITRDVTRQKQRQDELDLLASTDAMTGLANRRSFDLRLEDLVEEARHLSQAFSLLVIDVDRFKLYNDTYGHARGDTCLQAIAAAIAQSVRKADFAARYGGEEFAVLMPMTDEAGAKLVAEKIRQKVAGLKLPHDRNQPYGVATISIGVAAWHSSGTQPTDGHAFFSRADTALYEAKNLGRNRVVLASASLEASRVGTALSA